MHLAHDFLDTSTVPLKTTPSTVYNMGSINNLVHYFSVPGMVMARYNPPIREPPPSPSRNKAENRPSEEPQASESGSRDTSDSRPSAANEIFQRVPFLDASHLQACGLHISYLRKDPQSPYYSSTGSLVIRDDKLRQIARHFDQLEAPTLQALDKSFWQLLRTLFVMKKIPSFGGYLFCCSCLPNAPCSAVYQDQHRAK
jgi:hypothetical protein